ncbi:MAG: ATP-binding cassette domain-containing protein, partial [Micrococcales bacterium]|nr:ATP-binding cassette domain-containing protein [Micrococcales bacterium]
AALTGLVHDSGLTVVLAEHRLERVMQAADSVVWLPGDGRAVAGDPASVLTGADVTPPLVALARVLGWTEVPLSVREARRRVQREHIALAAPPPPAADGPATGRTADGAVLSARGIVVRYGELVAVDHVDLDLPGGSLTAVMGRNGAGKSSLLWALQGSLTCTGQLAVAGADPRRLSAAQARSLVVLVPQTAADLLYLPTVGDELAQADAESGAAAGTAAGRLTAMGFALDPRTDPRDLSEGQRLALVLAIQLAASPPVILLDEPTRGLDYAAKAALTDVLTGLAAAGAAVMVATHDVEFAAQTCPRMVLMAQGEIVASGPTAQLAASSPAYAPQLAKVFAPAPVLTARDVAAGLR